MKCTFCNKEISNKLSFKNLFSYKNDSYCKNCKENLRIKTFKHKSYKLHYLADYSFIRDSIYSIKYFGHIKECEKFSPALINFFRNNNFDLILIAPSNKTREAIRGFNHIKVIADIYNISYLDIFIEPYRLKQSKLQSGRKIHNFSIKKIYIDNVSNAKSILIIDDVFTSGKTLESLALSLLNINTNLNISFFTLAKSENVKPFQK